MTSCWAGCTLIRLSPALLQRGDPPRFSYYAAPAPEHRPSTAYDGSASLEHLGVHHAFAPGAWPTEADEAAQVAHCRQQADLSTKGDTISVNRSPPQRVPRAGRGAGGPAEGFIAGTVYHCSGVSPRCPKSTGPQRPTGVALVQESLQSTQIFGLPPQSGTRPDVPCCRQPLRPRSSRQRLSRTPADLVASHAPLQANSFSVRHIQRQRTTGG